MRLKAEIWVHAFLRRSFVQGMYGAVLRKGAAEAGAIYVVINRLDGTVRMLGPPPGLPSTKPVRGCGARSRRRSLLPPKWRLSSPVWRNSIPTSGWSR